MSLMWRRWSTVNIEEKEPPERAAPLLLEATTLPDPDPDEGLASFQLKPAHLMAALEKEKKRGDDEETRYQLLDHMTLFAKRTGKKGAKLQPSAYLNLEISSEQTMLFNPTIEDIQIREILRDAAGPGATKKLAKRKLDMCTYVNAFCCYANSPERIKRMREAVRVAASLAEIAAADITEQSMKKQEELRALTDLASEALEKWKSKANDFSKLTIKELRALRFRYYNVIEKKVGNKQQEIDKLAKLYESNPNILHNSQ